MIDYFKINFFKNATTCKTCRTSKYKSNLFCFVLSILMCKFKNFERVERR